MRAKAAALSSGKSFGWARAIPIPFHRHVDDQTRVPVHLHEGVVQ
jgi:hypothetical protein